MKTMPRMGMVHGAVFFSFNSYHGIPYISLMSTSFPRWMRSHGGDRPFLLGLAAIGVLAIISLLVADLRRELLRDSSDDGAEISSPVLGDLSCSRESGGSSCREPLLTKFAFSDSAQVAKATVDHPREIRAAGEPAPGGGSERMPSAGSDRVQASPADSAITASKANDSEDDLLVGKPRNASRASDLPGSSVPVGDDSFKEASLSTPLFYTLRESQFANLPPEQQQAVLSLQNEYINYHRDWTETSSGDISEWNDRMREFHLELVRRVGATAADALTR